jgi:hypothetical protein
MGAPLPRLYARNVKHDRRHFFSLFQSPLANICPGDPRIDHLVTIYPSMIGVPSAPSTKRVPTPYFWCARAAA